MKLKTRYILFIIIVHLSFGVITVLIYQQNKILFLICEAILIISLVLSFTLILPLFKPFKLLNAGIDSIADKDFSIKFLPVGNKELDKLFEVYNKMIDQLRLERTNVAEKHFFLQKMIDATPTGIIILDANKNIESINPYAQDLLEIDEKGEITEICKLPPPWNSELLNIKENDSRLIQINGISQYKCYRSSFLERGVKRTFYIIEELTKELLNAEKQSYEKVIRMISHEVNNSVGSVNSIIDSSIVHLRRFSSEKNEDFVDALAIAKERIFNLNTFTKKFADIVRIPPPEIQDCSINEIVTRILFYFKKDFEEKNIKIVTEFTSDNLTIPFDPQQLELVLINIMQNAIEAITGEGIITVKTRLSPATLIIGNNGEPIPADIQKRLFEPFFTTKRTGQGIGLTLIREILINHKAGFTLETNDDGMTEFKISLK
ncbi:sensor histidine kinase [Maribellus maritimus]|uniref:sensor histidine kinase n=1 Tax=Maribellus maritimus TaxID=2870838 RepID=UPI001EEB02C6|nr:ATP-binding protein [Maribellus maritimus]MCG6187895.1 GHKL domain-containing protein [Maribellus maritimus]